MDEVLSSVDAGILQIVINRPEQRNALNANVLKAISGAIREAGANRNIRAVTLTGSGDRVFCAGVDLKATAAGSETAFEPGRYRELLLEILRCPKPTVALARGHVMAGGLGLLLSCDLCLACDDVHFSTPEIHVGMFAMMVFALLYRHAGRKRATEMLFFGERISAANAVEFGIVNHAYPRDRFDAEASQYVRKLADKSAGILRLGKEAMFQVAGKSLPDEFQYLEAELAKVMSTADSKEGMRAFLEKRKPQWTDE